ncbi:unnamed protein product, partial [Choristocarpus tenellus]
MVSGSGSESGWRSESKSWRKAMLLAIIAREIPPVIMVEPLTLVSEVTKWLTGQLKRAYISHLRRQKNDRKHERARRSIREAEAAAFTQAPSSSHSGPWAGQEGGEISTSVPLATISGASFVAPTTASLGMSGRRGQGCSSAGNGVPLGETLKAQSSRRTTRMATGLRGNSRTLVGKAGRSMDSGERGEDDECKLDMLDANNEGTMPMVSPSQASVSGSLKGKGSGKEKAGAKCNTTAGGGADVGERGGEEDPGGSGSEKGNITDRLRKRRRVDSSQRKRGGEERGGSGGLGPRSRGVTTAGAGAASSRAEKDSSVVVASRGRSSTRSNRGKTRGRSEGREPEVATGIGAGSGALSGTGTSAEGGVHTLSRISRSRSYLKNLLNEEEAKQGEAQQSAGSCPYGSGGDSFGEGGEGRGRREASLSCRGGISREERREGGPGRCLPLLDVGTKVFSLFRVRGDSHVGSSCGRAGKGEGRRWYAGIVITASTNHLLGVRYDDGTLHCEVPLTHVTTSLPPGAPVWVGNGGAGTGTGGGVRSDSSSATGRDSIYETGRRRGVREYDSALQATQGGAIAVTRDMAQGQQQRTGPDTSTVPAATRHGSAMPTQTGPGLDDMLQGQDFVPPRIAERVAAAAAASASEMRATAGASASGMG